MMSRAPHAFAGLPVGWVTGGLDALKEMGASVRMVFREG